MIETGDVVRFFYLWKRQAEAGEETGRKSRPVCVVVKTPKTPQAVFLFPITSQPPDPSIEALAISQIECRRGGLHFPCWIVLDEYNRVELDRLFDFESTKPIGNLSPAFLKKVAQAIKEVAATRRLSGVSRG